MRTLLFGDVRCPRHAVQFQGHGHAEYVRRVMEIPGPGQPGRGVRTNCAVAPWRRLREPLGPSTTERGTPIRSSMTADRFSAVALATHCGSSDRSRLTATCNCGDEKWGDKERTWLGSSQPRACQKRRLTLPKSEADRGYADHTSGVGAMGCQWRSASQQEGLSQHRA